MLDVIETVTCISYCMSFRRQDQRVPKKPPVFQDIHRTMECAGHVLHACVRNIHNFINNFSTLFKGLIEQTLFNCLKTNLNQKLYFCRLFGH